MLCSLLIRENYLNDSSSQVVNSKLESLCNTYGGRILVVDRDFKIVKDTYSADQGRTLVSPQIIQCFKGENIQRYNSGGAAASGSHAGEHFYAGDRGYH
mgnify:CR=1 FL=1